MNKILFVTTALSVAGTVAGCAGGAGRRQGAQADGAPRVAVSRAVLDRAAPLSGVADPVALAPDQLVVPGTYRLVVVDGRSMLVRETDPRKVLTSPAVQIVASEPMGTDLAIQPALLPQEVAEEIARNRAQMDAVLRVLPAMFAEQKRLNEELSRLQGNKAPEPEPKSETK